MLGKARRQTLKERWHLRQELLPSDKENSTIWQTDGLWRKAITVRESRIYLCQQLSFCLYVFTRLSQSRFWLKLAKYIVYSGCILQNHLKNTWKPLHITHSPCIDSCVSSTPTMSFTQPWRKHVAANWSTWTFQCLNPARVRSEQVRWPLLWPRHLTWRQGWGTVSSRRGQDPVSLTSVWLSV